MLVEEIKNLSESEKWLLFNDLWDELAQNPHTIELSEEQKKVLDERYQEFLANPEEGIPWDEAKARILESL